LKIKNRPKFSVFHMVMILCVVYALIGAVLWIISFTGTKWNELRTLCCSNCDGVWYSKYWTYYEIYTLPFIILTFPLYKIFYDIENIKIWSIVSIYLPFIPCLFWSIVLLIRKKKMLKNNIE
jgi:hypothetical protein